MAPTKRRSAAAANISKAAIDQVGTTLQDLPEKPRENLSLREAVATLQDSITTALDRGYSYEEVVSILSKQGVDITVASLKRYLAAARKQAEDKPKQTKRGGRRNASLEKQAAALSAAVNGNGASAPKSPLPTEMAEATPKRRTSGRAKAAEKAPAKVAEKAPRAKTAAKAKPTSRAAKTTTRSTSSRSSRKGKGATQ